MRFQVESFTPANARPFVQYTVKGLEAGRVAAYLCEPAEPHAAVRWNPENPGKVWKIFINKGRPHLRASFPSRGDGSL